MVVVTGEDGNGGDDDGDDDNDGNGGGGEDHDDDLMDFEVVLSREGKLVVLHRHLRHLLGLPADHLGGQEEEQIIINHDSPSS